MSKSHSLPIWGPVIVDEFARPNGLPLEEVDPNNYYEILGSDGKGLLIPSDLDELIRNYSELAPVHRKKFERAAYWFSTASRMWNVSTSASFAALVSAIEALTVRGSIHKFDCPICRKPTQHENPGPTQLFREFLEAYAPGATLAGERKLMYELRSGILHGNDLMQLDWEIPTMGWTPSGLREEQLHRSLWGVTHIALRNWLISPAQLTGGLLTPDYDADRSLRETAYFHWMDRGRPLWEAEVDWEWAKRAILDGEM